MSDTNFWKFWSDPSFWKKFLLLSEMTAIGVLLPDVAAHVRGWMIEMVKQSVPVAQKEILESLMAKLTIIPVRRDLIDRFEISWYPRVAGPPSLEVIWTSSTTRNFWRGDHALISDLPEKYRNLPRERLITYFPQMCPGHSTEMSIPEILGQ